MLLAAGCAFTRVAAQAHFLQQLCRNFADKPRRRVIGFTAVQAAALGAQGRFGTLHRGLQRLWAGRQRNVVQRGGNRLHLVGNMGETGLCRGAAQRLLREQVALRQQRRALLRAKNSARNHSDRAATYDLS